MKKPGAWAQRFDALRSEVQLLAAAVEDMRAQMTMIENVSRDVDKALNAMLFAEAQLRTQQRQKEHVEWLEERRANRHAEAMATVRTEQFDPRKGV